ncbi:hypothetical protein ILUMI_04675 [Ignelater luminosus]|uniref:Uncharacterized protein n=1 Tax=Ignelater luminosus TaxID=2038154 RepID=A0A8K0DJ97_IGNLU|nr:hypothetical protein ILUMI_04675 [Ignelater luminosus]
MTKGNIKQPNTRTTQAILEENKGMKVFRKNIRPKKVITKLKHKNGEIVNDRRKMLQVTQNFHRALYKSKAACQIQEDIKRKMIVNVNSEELPLITKNEIETTVEQMKNGKTTEDGILAKMLKESGETLLHELENKIIKWRSWRERRGVSRPQMRWADDIKQTAELKWVEIAQNKQK